MFAKNASTYWKPVKLLVYSNLGALRMNLAVQFWICWSLLIMHRGRPARRDFSVVQARNDKRKGKFLCCGSVKKMANRTDASEL